MHAIARTALLLVLFLIIGSGCAPLHTKDGKTHTSQVPFENSSVPNPDDILKGEAKGQEMRIQRLARQFEAAHAKEPVDPKWSQTYEAEVKQFFVQHSAGVFQLQRVACRTTLCKLNVTHDAVGRDKFIAFLSAGPLSGGGFYYATPDGAESVVYLSRPDRTERISKILALAESE